MKLLSRRALLVAIAVAGCDEGGDPATYTVRDSARIQIVENAGSGWTGAQAWRLSAEPTLEIGEVDGASEYQFTRIGSVARLSNGRIAVADRGSGEIRYFDATGTHLMTTGGSGSRLGEFDELSWFEALPGDALLAFDNRNLRLSTFDPEGKFVRATTLEPDSGIPQITSRFTDGTLLATYPRPVIGRRDGVYRDTLTFLRLSANGSSLNAVARLRGAEQMVGQRADGRGSATLELAFGRSALAAAAGDRFFAGENDSYQIGVYSLEGTLRRLIRRQVEPRAVTDGDRAALQAENVAMKSADAGVEQLLEEMRDRMPIPSTLPAYSQFRVAKNGDLWVQDYPAAVDVGTSWTVFDQDGLLRGSVSMPHGFQAQEIGADYVLGVWRNDLDVEHVRLYALQKPD